LVLSGNGTSIFQQQRSRVFYLFRQVHASNNASFLNVHRVQKKGATDFFAVTFTNFSCTTSQENAKVIGEKMSCHTFVMLLPYRVKLSDTKVTHFTAILALCTCLYRSHLQKPVSPKQTKHSRKSEAQNLCSQCPPFTRTRAFNRLRHCAIADFDGMCPVLVLRNCTSWNQGLRSTVTITGIQFCWISALFSGITTFFSKMGHRHIGHVTLSPCCRERRQSLSLQRCGHLIRQI